MYSHLPNNLFGELVKKFLLMKSYKDYAFMELIHDDDCVDICEFIFNKYHVMTFEIYSRIDCTKQSLAFLTQHTDEDELEMMEWILEAVDNELDNRTTLEDIGMCLADFC